MVLLLNNEHSVPGPKVNQTLVARIMKKNTNKTMEYIINFRT